MHRYAAGGLSCCCFCCCHAFVDDRQSSAIEHAEAFENAETALPAGRPLNGPLPPTIYGPIREHDVCGRRIIVRPTRDGCYITFKTVFFRHHLAPTAQLWFHTFFLERLATPTALHWCHCVLRRCRTQHVCCIMFSKQHLNAARQPCSYHGVSHEGASVAE